MSGIPEWNIESEGAEHRQAVEELVANVFGPGRYAKAAYRLREGVDPEAALSFVAIENGILRGSVRFWPIVVGGYPALLLGPLAVQSDQRGRGIGIALMQRGIDEARRLGHRAIMLVGDVPYYARVGFAPLPKDSVKFPGPVDRGRILGLALVEGALDRLEGHVLRAPSGHPVGASGVPVAARNANVGSNPNSS